MSRRTLLLVTIALFTASVVTYWVWNHQPQTSLGTRKVIEESDDPYFDPNTPAASVDENKLQDLAVSSCTCERDGISKEKCWSGYQEAIAGYKVNGVASACAPISSEADCIATDAGEKCIVTGYNVVVGTGGNSVLCSAEEALAVESAYTEAFNKVTGGRPDYDEATLRAADEAATAALTTTLARIRRGEAVAAVESTEGCVG